MNGVTARAGRGPDVETPLSKGNRVRARSGCSRQPLHVFRTKGYTATTVDDPCAAAGLTKGTDFHNFKSKDCGARLFWPKRRMNHRWPSRLWIIFGVITKMLFRQGEPI